LFAAREAREAARVRLVAGRNSIPSEMQARVGHGQQSRGAGRGWGLMETSKLASRSRPRAPTQASRRAEKGAAIQGDLRVSSPSVPAKKARSARRLGSAADTASAPVILWDDLDEGGGL